MCYYKNAATMFLRLDALQNDKHAIQAIFPVRLSAKDNRLRIHSWF